MSLTPADIIVQPEQNEGGQIEQRFLIDCDKVADELESFADEIKTREGFLKFMRLIKTLRGNGK